MLRHLILVTLVFAAGSGLAARDPAPAPDLKGRLAKAFFGPGTDVAAALDAIAAEAGGEVGTELAAAAVRAKQPPAHGLAALGEGPARAPREALMRGMLALMPVTTAGDSFALAASAAGEAPVPAAGALDPTALAAEAQWAERYLKDHRDSPLTPYLYPYLMTRHRLAYELATAAGDIAARKAAARKYRAFLLRARTLTEPVARWLVEDVDRAAQLDRPTDIHPRDYDPDACCNGRKG